MSEQTPEQRRIHQLCQALGEAYQVIGHMHMTHGVAWSESDVEMALDNIAAAIDGDPAPHENLLPWPKNPTRAA